MSGRILTPFSLSSLTSLYYTTDFHQDMGTEFFFKTNFSLSKHELLKRVWHKFSRVPV
jgi:hypothetical protein